MNINIYFKHNQKAFKGFVVIRTCQSANSGSFEIKSFDKCLGGDPYVVGYCC